MAEGITIRLFAPGDQVKAQQLVLDGLAEHFPRIDPTLNTDLQEIEKNYLGHGATFLVAVSGHEIVGTGALIPETNDTARMVRVSVAKACRRKGIGSSLVTALVKAASDLGYDSIVVETNDDWYEAIFLYQAFGFVEFDRRDREVHMVLHLWDTPQGGTRQ